MISLERSERTTSSTTSNPPCGSQGKVVCLVSGRTDSPVAAWPGVKRGCIPIFVFYDNYPFTATTITVLACFPKKINK